MLKRAHRQNVQKVKNNADGTRTTQNMRMCIRMCVSYVIETSFPFGVLYIWILFQNASSQLCFSFFPTQLQLIIIQTGTQIDTDRQSACERELEEKDEQKQGINTNARKQRKVRRKQKRANGSKGGTKNESKIKAVKEIDKVMK